MGGGAGLAGVRECTVGTGRGLPAGACFDRAFQVIRMSVCVLWEPAGAACRRVTPGEETGRGVPVVI